MTVTNDSAMSHIAAVVPTLGASPYLAEALEALGRETGPEGEPVEIFLVHPAGADLPFELPGRQRVRRLATERPLGFAEATNRGIAAARDTGTRWIATVNDDLRVSPGWAAYLVRALEETPDACAAQGVQLRLDDPSRVDGCGLAWTRDWQAVQLGHGQPPPSPDAPVREIFGVSATAAVYRATCFDRVPLDRMPGRNAPGGKGLGGEGLGGEGLGGEGPFDPQLGSYYEDVDLACRLRAHRPESEGGRALLVPAARALHAGSATGGAHSLRRWRWIYGNRWLVLGRLLGRRLPREAPRILLRDLKDLARALGTGELRKSAGILAGWGRALRRGPAFAHRGAPTVALDVLERFRISSAHP